MPDSSARSVCSAAGCDCLLRLARGDSRAWPAAVQGAGLSIRGLIVLARRERDVAAAQQPDQATIGGGDRRAVEVSVGHGPRHLLDRHIRPEGAGTWPHGLLDPKI